MTPSAQDSQTQQERRHGNCAWAGMQAQQLLEEPACHLEESNHVGSGGFNWQPLQLHNAVAALLRPQHAVPFRPAGLLQQAGGQAERGGSVSGPGSTMSPAREQAGCSRSLQPLISLRAAALACTLSWKMPAAVVIMVPCRVPTACAACSAASKSTNACNPSGRQ